jgi:aerobic carbon-monoxide dehydrogenase large subunit
MKFIGERMLRKEDDRLLRGQGHYVGDLRIPGMLDVAIIRSPHAHAGIARVDTSIARQQPGVVDIVSFEDLADAGRMLPWMPPHPALVARNFHILARDRARFVGEAVMAVVAQNRYLAEDAAELVAIDWEPLASVQDIEASPSALVHDDVPDNVAGRVTLTRGDVTAALRAAGHVVSERLTISRGGGHPIEPRGLAAEYNPTTGLLTVWVSSQVPHQIRQLICEFFSLRQERVRVLAPDVGGGFGAKLIVYPEDLLIPFLALRLGRPVRWLEDRAEHMRAATQERLQIHDVTIGFDADGRILALRDRFLHDTGAYTPRGLAVPLLTATMLPGPYRIPNLDITMVSLYTNRVPVTPYRGAGQPQAVFVIERVLDRIAREIGRDRAAVRLANMIGPDEMPYDVGIPNFRNDESVVYDSGDFPAVLRHALQMSQWNRLTAEAETARAHGGLLGVGVACYIELTGIGPFEGATVRIDPSGRVTVLTGVTSQGQGLETTLAQVCASELGLTPSDVDVVLGDTGGIAYGIGTFASRAAVVGASAVALAARELRAKALRLAARSLAVQEEELQQSGLAFVDVSRPERRVTFRDLSAAAALASWKSGIDPGLEATSFFQPENTTYSSGAHVAVIELDPVSLRVTVRGYWISHDSGRLINPMVVDGQTHGAVALGLGAALLEEVVYDESGQPLTGSYMDYLMPTATDVPSMVVDHLETLSTLNPHGFKGVGESGTLPVSALIASAVEDALARRGARLTSAPLTPSRLHAALHGEQSSV